MSLSRRSNSRSLGSWLCAAGAAGAVPISADTFPHATTSGPAALARRLPLLRHEAARSFEKVAAVRWGPQYAVRSTSSSRHSNEQSALSQLVRTTRIAPPALPAPADPSGPCAPWGPAGPCGPGAPRGPAGPGGPAGPASPFAPAGPGGPGSPFDPLEPGEPGQQPARATETTTAANTLAVRMLVLTTSAGAQAGGVSYNQSWSSV